MKNDHQNLQDHTHQVEQERDNLNKYDKAFSDRICAFIPDKNDDERANIVDHNGKSHIFGIFYLYLIQLKTKNVFNYFSI